MNHPIIALESKYYDELEEAAWAIPDHTPAGKRLREAVKQATMHRRIVPCKVPEPKQNDTQLG